jgi:myosin heavy subunit
MEIVKGEGVPDSVLLEDISENGFVKNLQIRYDKKLIYVISIW